MLLALQLTSSLFRAYDTPHEHLIHQTVSHIRFPMLHCDIIQPSLHIDSSLLPNVLELQIKTYTTKTLIYEEMVADFLFVRPLFVFEGGGGVWIHVCVFAWWCLTPLSKIFQLYRGGQFYQLRKQEDPKKTISNYYWVHFTTNTEFICFKRSGNQFLSQLNCEFEPRSWQGVL